MNLLFRSILVSLTMFSVVGLAGPDPYLCNIYDAKHAQVGYVTETGNFAEKIGDKYYQAGRINGSDANLCIWTSLGNCFEERAATIGTHGGIHSERRVLKASLSKQGSTKLERLGYVNPDTREVMFVREDNSEVAIGKVEGDGCDLLRNNGDLLRAAAGAFRVLMLDEARWKSIYIGTGASKFPRM